MLKKFLIGVITCLLAVNVISADNLAVAEPVGKGGMSEQDIEAIWSMLEATVDGGYTLISRSALQQMLTEIGLTNSSDLMNLNSNQRAKMGEIKTVKYILVPTVSKFGSRINFSLIMVDSSTGEIVPDSRTSLTVSDLDELADKLQDTLNEIGLGTETKSYGRSAILTPVVNLKTPPSYMANYFNVCLEESLLDNSIKLQNLQSVAKILAKNNIDELYAVEPAMFVRIAGLLRVDFLVQATINEFNIEKESIYVAASKRNVVLFTGTMSGNIRIISGRTGELVGSIRFHEKIDFSDLSGTEDWDGEDYGVCMIESTLPGIVEKVIKKLK